MKKISKRVNTINKMINQTLDLVKLKEVWSKYLELNDDEKELIHLYDLLVEDYSIKKTLISKNKDYYFIYLLDMMIKNNFYLLESNNQLVTLEKQVIESLRQIYQGLSDYQKTISTGLPFLIKSEEMVIAIERRNKAFEEASNFDKQILEIEIPLSLKDEEFINDKLKEYILLEEDVKELVNEYPLLLEMKETINDMNKASLVDEMALDIREDFTLEDKGEILRLKCAYDSLSINQLLYLEFKEMIIEIISKYESMIVQENDKHVSSVLDKQIIITLDTLNKAVDFKVKEEFYEMLHILYDQATDNQLAYLENIAYLDEIEILFEKAEKDYKYENEAFDVIKSIDELPTSLDYLDKEDIVSILDNYNSLSLEAQEKVYNKGVLDYQVKYLDKKKKALEIEEIIRNGNVSSIVDIDSLCLDLDDETRRLIDHEVIQSLYRNELNGKESHKKTEKIMCMIDQIGEVNFDDLPLIKGILHLYDELEDAEKEKITNYDVLIEALDILDKKSDAMHIDSLIKELRLSIDSISLVQQIEELLIDTDILDYVEEIDEFNLKKEFIYQEDEKVKKIISDIYDLEEDYTLLPMIKEEYSMLDDDSKKYVKNYSLIQLYEEARRESRNKANNDTIDDNVALELELLNEISDLDINPDIRNKLEEKYTSVMKRIGY